MVLVRVLVLISRTSLTALITYVNSAIILVVLPVNTMIHTACPATAHKYSVWKTTHVEPHVLHHINSKMGDNVRNAILPV